MCENSVPFLAKRQSVIISRSWRTIFLQETVDEEANLVFDLWTPPSAPFCSAKQECTFQFVAFPQKAL